MNPNLGNPILGHHFRIYLRRKEAVCGVSSDNERVVNETGQRWQTNGNGPDFNVVMLHSHHQGPNRFLTG